MRTRSDCSRKPSSFLSSIKFEPRRRNGHAGRRADVGVFAKIVFPEEIRTGKCKLQEDFGSLELIGLTGRAIVWLMKVIAAYEAKSRFSELLREAAAGEVFIITRNGQKRAELRACQSEKPARIRGMMKSEIPPIPADFNEPLDVFAEYQ